MSSYFSFPPPLEDDSSLLRRKRPQFGAIPDYATQDYGSPGVQLPPNLQPQVLNAPPPNLQPQDMGSLMPRNPMPVPYEVRSPRPPVYSQPVAQTAPSVSAFSGNPQQVDPQPSYSQNLSSIQPRTNSSISNLQASGLPMNLQPTDLDMPASPGLAPSFRGTAGAAHGGDPYVNINRSSPETATSARRLVNTGLEAPTLEQHREAIEDDLVALYGPQLRHFQEITGEPLIGSLNYKGHPMTDQDLQEIWRANAGRGIPYSITDAQRQRYQQLQAGGAGVDNPQAGNAMPKERDLVDLPQDNSYLSQAARGVYNAASGVYEGLPAAGGPLGLVTAVPEAVIKGITVLQDIASTPRLPDGSFDYSGAASRLMNGGFDFSRAVAHSGDPNSTIRSAAEIPAEVAGTIGQSMVPGAGGPALFIADAFAKGMREHGDVGEATKSAINTAIAFAGMYGANVPLAKILKESEAVIASKHGEGAARVFSKTASKIGAGVNMANTNAGMNYLETGEAPTAKGYGKDVLTGAAYESVGDITRGLNTPGHIADKGVAAAKNVIGADKPVGYVVTGSGDAGRAMAVYEDGSHSEVPIGAVPASGARIQALDPAAFNQRFDAGTSNQVKPLVTDGTVPFNKNLPEMDIGNGNPFYPDIYEHMEDARETHDIDGSKPDPVEDRLRKEVQAASIAAGAPSEADPVGSRQIVRGGPALDALEKARRERIIANGGNPDSAENQDTLPTPPAVDKEKLLQDEDNAKTDLQFLRDYNDTLPDQPSPEFGRYREGIRNHIESLKRDLQAKPNPETQSILTALVNHYNALGQGREIPAELGGKMPEYKNSPEMKQRLADAEAKHQQAGMLYDLAHGLKDPEVLAEHDQATRDMLDAHGLDSSDPSLLEPDRFARAMNDQSGKNVAVKTERDMKARSDAEARRRELDAKAAIDPNATPADDFSNPVKPAPPTGNGTIEPEVVDAGGKGDNHYNYGTPPPTYTQSEWDKVNREFRDADLNLRQINSRLNRQDELNLSDQEVANLEEQQAQAYEKFGRLRQLVTGNGSLDVESTVGNSNKTKQLPAAPVDSDNKNGSIEPNPVQEVANVDATSGNDVKGISTTPVKQLGSGERTDVSGQPVDPTISNATTDSGFETPTPTPVSKSPGDGTTSNNSAVLDTGAAPTVDNGVSEPPTTGVSDTTGDQGSSTSEGTANKPTDVGDKNVPLNPIEARKTAEANLAEANRRLRSAQTAAAGKGAQPWQKATAAKAQKAVQQAERKLDRINKAIEAAARTRPTDQNKGVKSDIVGTGVRAIDSVYYKAIDGDNIPHNAQARTALSTPAKLRDMLSENQKGSSKPTRYSPSNHGAISNLTAEEYTNAVNASLQDQGFAKIGEDGGPTQANELNNYVNQVYRGIKNLNNGILSNPDFLDQEITIGDSTKSLRDRLIEKARTDDEPELAAQLIDPSKVPQPDPHNPVPTSEDGTVTPQAAEQLVAKGQTPPVKTEAGDLAVQNADTIPVLNKRIKDAKTVEELADLKGQLVTRVANEADNAKTNKQLKQVAALQRVQQRLDARIAELQPKDEDIPKFQAPVDPSKQPHAFMPATEGSNGFKRKAEPVSIDPDQSGVPSGKVRVIGSDGTKANIIKSAIMNGPPQAKKSMKAGGGIYLDPQYAPEWLKKVALPAKLAGKWAGGVIYDGAAKLADSVANSKFGKMVGEIKRNLAPSSVSPQARQAQDLINFHNAMRQANLQAQLSDQSYINAAKAFDSATPEEIRSAREGGGPAPSDKVNNLIAHLQFGKQIVNKYGETLKKEYPREFDSFIQNSIPALFKDSARAASMIREYNQANPGVNPETGEIQPRPAKAKGLNVGDITQYYDYLIAQGLEPKQENPILSLGGFSNMVENHIATYRLQADSLRLGVMQPPSLDGKIPEGWSPVNGKVGRQKFDMPWDKGADPNKPSKITVKNDGKTIKIDPDSVPHIYTDANGKQSLGFVKAGDLQVSEASEPLTKNQYIGYDQTNPIRQAMRDAGRPMERDNPYLKVNESQEPVTREARPGDKIQVKLADGRTVTSDYAQLSPIDGSAADILNMDAYRQINKDGTSEIHFNDKSDTDTTTLINKLTNQAADGTHPTIESIQKLAPSELPTRRQTTQLYAPDSVAHVYNTMLGEPDGNKKWEATTDFLHSIRGATQIAQTALSAYHFWTITHEASINEQMIAQQKLANGDIKGALGNYMRSILPGHAGAMYYMKGREATKAFLDPEYAKANPEAAARKDAVLRAGGTLGTPSQYETHFGKEVAAGIAQATSKTATTAEKAAGYWKAIKNLPLGGAELFSKPLSWYIDNAKVAAFHELMIAKGDKIDPTKVGEMDINRLYNQTWDEVENRMGHVNYDRWGLDNMTKQAMFALVNFPGWNGGTLKQLGGGISDLAQTGKRVASGGDKMTDKMHYWLAATTHMAMMGLATNLVLTGQLPGNGTDEDPKTAFLKDILYPRNGKIGPDGTPERLNQPTIVKDILPMMQAIGSAATGDLQPASKFLGSKFSTTLGSAFELMSNKDYFGNQIYRPGSNAPRDVFNYLVKRMTPFSLKDVNAQIKDQGYGDAAWQVAKDVLGNPKASGEIAETKFQRTLKAVYNQKYASGGLTVDTQEMLAGRKDLRTAVENGDLNAISRAMDKQEITAKQGKQLLDAADTTSYERKFAKMDISTQADLFSLMSKEERKNYAPALIDKMDTLESSNMPPMQQLAVIDKLESIGVLPHINQEKYKHSYNLAKDKLAYQIQAHQMPGYDRLGEAGQAYVDKQISEFIGSFKSMDKQFMTNAQVEAHAKAMAEVYRQNVTNRPKEMKAWTQSIIDNAPRVDQKDKAEKKMGGNRTSGTVTNLDNEPINTPSEEDAPTSASFDAPL